MVDVRKLYLLKIWPTSPGRLTTSPSCWLSLYFSKSSIGDASFFLPYLVASIHYISVPPLVCGAGHSLVGGAVRPQAPFSSGSTLPPASQGSLTRWEPPIHERTCEIH